MENDIENHLTNNINEMKADNIFKLDYNGQSLKNNLKFNSWKDIILQKYGNDAKLFKCSYDGIYFYCSYESFRKLPLCSSICPSCNQSICYYCSKIAHNYNSFGDCCLRRRIYYKLFYDGFLFIKILFFAIFISYLHFFFLQGAACVDLFYNNLRKNKSEVNQEYYDNGGKIFCISRLINALMAFMLSIIYMIHSFYFKIFLLVISIFTKNYPIKYYLGIIRGAQDHFG